MRKFVFAFILTTFIGGFVYHAFQYGWRSLFVPVNMKQIQGTDISELQEIAEESETYFKKNVKEKKAANNVAVAYKRLGFAYLEKRKWEPAITALEKAVEYGANGARVHHSLGAAYANKGKQLSNRSDVKKAELHYSLAIEKNPELLDAYYGKAILKFYLTNQQDEAITILKNIINKDSSYFDARFALARFYYETDKSNLALKTYNDLYSDLEKVSQTKRIQAYKKKCRENIEILQARGAATRK